MLVTRIQFFAIEIARNKRGVNKFHMKQGDRDGGAAEAEKKEASETNNNPSEDLTEKINSLNTDTDDNAER